MKKYDITNTERGETFPAVHDETTLERELGDRNSDNTSQGTLYQANDSRMGISDEKINALRGSIEKYLGLTDTEKKNLARRGDLRLLQAAGCGSICDGLTGDFRLKPGEF